MTGELGFGCAELFRLGSARARRRVLDAALDAGVTHFDVAPMYGLGAAEHELGSFAAGRRDRVMIATKFGIDVTPAARAIGRVQGPLRRVMEARPGLRSRARASAAGPSSGSAGGLLYDELGYGAASARASLERSLRALRTDHVDLLLLHDPAPDRVDEDVAAYLEVARGQGLIRAWGVAGEPGPTLATARAFATRPLVVQVRDDVFEPSRDDIGETRITFGTLGSAVPRITTGMRERPEVRGTWREAFGYDLGDPESVAPLLLRLARLRNPAGITLFSTTRPTRVATAVSAAGATSMDEAASALASLAENELTE